MSLSYEYILYIALMSASILLVVALGVYCLRHRSIPGAFPLALTMFLTLPWAVGAVLNLVVTDESTQIFLIEFKELWLLPATTAILCFALEYANLGRWLTRRTLILLVIPILIEFLLTLTNDIHHWAWVTVPGQVEPERGLGFMILMGYGYVLVMLHLSIFIWLFVRSPVHRWPVGLMLISRIVTAAGFFLNVAMPEVWGPFDMSILLAIVVSPVYGLALFRFRILDIVPVARSVLTERIREGVMVVDTQNRIVDLNRAAEKLFNLRTPDSIGKPLSQVLHAYPRLTQGIGDHEVAHSEILVETGAEPKYYDINVSTLMHERGLIIGRLILLRDITEGKRAQHIVLEQQRALASIAERAQLARELHDGLGQTLGYIKMRAQTARDLLAQNQVAAADACLENLVAVAQESHTDIREYLLGASASVAANQDFLSALRSYLEQFSEHYSIHTDLKLPSHITAEIFDATVQVQLLRIIQEALTNARKHARAQSVQISIAATDHLAQIAIQDDGVGFDPANVTQAEGRTFGLRFMRERAEQVGGSVQIESNPGQGTRVIVGMPITTQQEIRG